MVSTIHRPPLAAPLILALFAWLLWAGDSAVRATPAVTAVPTQVGPWTGTPLPVSDRALALLETDDVTVMEYQRGDEPPLWFAQVVGVGNRAAFHPPELCYVGSHFEILQREPITVPVHGQSRQVMRLVIRQGSQQFEAWYWFTAKGRTTPNYYQQQLWLVSDAIRRTPTSGTLVRISTLLDNPDASRRRLLAFLASLPHGV